MQDRSRATARRIIDAAIELLHQKTYAELSVAELSRTAGRSVGVFYQRFGSKDEFLEVLLSAFFEKSMAWRSSFDCEGSAQDLYCGFLRKGFDTLMDNRNLWHAALARSAVEPKFWDVWGPLRSKIAAITRASIETRLGREFAPDEVHRLALAAQVFNSVINNQIINSPGPLMLEHEDFYPELEKIVLAIAQVPDCAVNPG